MGLEPIDFEVERQVMVALQMVPEKWVDVYREWTGLTTTNKLSDNSLDAMNLRRVNEYVGATTKGTIAYYVRLVPPGCDSTAAGGNLARINYLMLVDDEGFPVPPDPDVIKRPR